MFNPILGLQNLDLLSVGIAVAGMTLIGFTVLFNDSRSITNRIFFYLAVTSSLWGSLNYLFNQPYSLSLSFWLLRLVMFFGALASFLTFTFAYVFNSDEIKFPNYYNFLIIPLTVIVMILTLTPLVFSGVREISPEGRIARVSVGPGIFLFGALTILLNFGAIYFLAKKALKRSNEERKTLYIILSGFFITVFLIITFNFILPAFFNITRFISLGALFMFPLIAFTSYAILRYRLFNIKVTGVTILVFLLAVSVFFEIIFATLERDLVLLIYRSSVLILVLVIGVFLIRGVMKEVEQREKLAELNKKLRVAYEEVDKLSKTKSEFISIASHQLRTPLSAIKGYISMIIEGTYGELPAKAKIPLEKVYQSNERLINLVNDLLNISRIEAGRMEFEPEPAQLEEIINSVIAELKITAEHKNLYLKWEKPKQPLPKLMLDKNKIRQVFLNLVNNAIKYTNKGGISITSEIQNPESEKDKKIIIVIRDTGEGMDKDDLAKIFETFSRGTAGTLLATEGAGLGLYIARKFVEMHKGRVWAESEGKGKGSTFYVELPV